MFQVRIQTLKNVKMCGISLFFRIIIGNSRKCQHNSSFLESIAVLISILRLVEPFLEEILNKKRNAFYIFESRRFASLLELQEKRLFDKLGNEFLNYDSCFENNGAHTDLSLD